MGRARIVGLVVGLALAAAGGTVWAADGDPAGWPVTLTPYLWAAGVSGDVTVAGVTVSPDATFIDVVQASDSLFGFQGHLEVTRGRLGAFADLFYMKLGVDDIGPTQVDLTNR